jgi:predicted nucleotidyltransferase
MPIPEFNTQGDLPVGVHPATLEEVYERFGAGTPQRQLVTKRLKRIYELAHRTGKVERFVIYGSYVTAKLAPNDVDIFLVMRDDFLLLDCEEEVASVFQHMQAHDKFGASIFWTSVSGVLLVSIEEFIAYWQTKREQGKRGIIEVI